VTQPAVRPGDLFARVDLFSLTLRWSSTCRKVVRSHPVVPGGGVLRLHDGRKVRHVRKYGWVGRTQQRVERFGYALRVSPLSRIRHASSIAGVRAGGAVVGPASPGFGSASPGIGFSTPCVQGLRLRDDQERSVAGVPVWHSSFWVSRDAECS
jgi:hypothetical protein